MNIGNNYNENDIAKNNINNCVYRFAHFIPPLFMILFMRQRVIAYKNYTFFKTILFAELLWWEWLGNKF